MSGRACLFASALLAVGCGAPVPSDPGAVEAEPRPGPYDGERRAGETLSHDPLIAGQPADFTVTGALPGETVHFARAAGPGAGPCAGPAGGVCLDLDPATAAYVGSAVADGVGTATLTVPIPAAALGAHVYAQAAIARGASSVKTNVVDDVVTGADTGATGDTGGTTGTQVASIDLLASVSARMAPHTVFVSAAGLLGPTNPHRAKLEWDFDRTDQAAAATVVDPRTSAVVDLETEQRGFNAAYTYTSPGTYEILLRVTDEWGGVATDTVTVTVTPDTRTTIQVDPSLGEVLPALASDTRVLVRRGTTLPISGASIGGSNVVLGAYGTGPAPILQMSGSSAAVTVSSSAENVAIEDLTFESTSALIPDCLLINGDAVAVRNVDLLTPSGLSPTFDNFVDHRSTANGVFMDGLDNMAGQTRKYVLSPNGTNMVLVGSTLRQPYEEALSRLDVRGGQTTSFVSYAFNDFRHYQGGPDAGGAAKDILRIQYGQFVSYYRNRIQGQVSLAHKRRGTFDVVVDSNLITVEAVSGAPANRFSIKENAERIMIRNNVVFASGDYRFHFETAHDTDPGPSIIDKVELVANTFIREGDHTYKGFLKLTGISPITNIRVSDNLFVGSGAAPTDWIVRASGAGAVAEAIHNVFPDYGGAFTYTSSFANDPTNARETVLATDLVAPDYRPPLGYVLTTQTGAPVAGVLDDYHNKARGSGTWYAGAVDAP